MKAIEVDHVEPPDHGTIEEDRPNALEPAQAPHERDDAASPVRTVDRDLSYADRIDTLGKRHEHGGDRGVSVPTVEGTVVDAHHLRVRFPERAPQR